MLETQILYLVVITNMAHCVIKSEKCGKHKFAYLCFMFRPKNNTNCPKISVFGPKNSVFGPKLGTNIHITYQTWYHLKGSLLRLFNMTCKT